MQEIDHTFIYKRNPGLVPWWMIAGTTLSGSTLLIGRFSEREVSALTEISNSIERINSLDYIDDKNNKPNEMAKAYDLIIINMLNIETPLILSHQNSEMIKLLDNALAVVLLESNPFHIKQIIRRPLGIVKSLFYDVRTRQIRQLFNGMDIVKYETISHANCPYESFPVSTYFSNKNSFLKLEKIKVSLLNSVYSRIFYNSLIWTLTLNKKFLVQSILGNVRKNNYFKWEGKQIKLLKILFNNGKIILSLTSRAKNQPEYILILPFDEIGLQQRINEKEAIKNLRSMNEFSNYFVKEIITGTVDHLTYFAMKEFSGITVDIGNPKLHLMIDNAFGVIKKLSKIDPDTGTTIRGKRISGIYSAYIALMLKRFPQHSSTIKRLEKSLPRYIDMPLIVFMHGDMKLENFVIDPQTNQVIGIIDLELAEFPGVPLIDLFYLITYNYQTVNQETFYQSYSRLITNDLTAIESAYLEDYCSLLNINENQKKICLAFFYLHHFAKRMGIAIDNKSANEDFLAGCESIIEMFKKLPPPG